MYRLLGAEMSEALENGARGLYPEMGILHQKVLFAPPQDGPVEPPIYFLRAIQKILDENIKF